jgi:6-phosphogluconolactonase
VKCCRKIRLITKTLLFLSFAFALSSCGILWGGIQYDNSNYNYFVYVGNFTTANISVFSMDPNSGNLTEIIGSPFTTPGSWVQGMTTDPTNTYAYAVMFTTDQLSAFTISPTSGALSPMAGSPIPTTNGGWPTLVNPTGNMLYVANGGVSSITEYSLSGGFPTLAATIPSGAQPDGMLIDPTGSYLYSTNSAGPNISEYSIAPGTGLLTNIGTLGTGGGTNPSDLVQTPSGSFIYETNDINLLIYQPTPGTGLLVQVGAPVVAANQLGRIAIDPTGHFVYADCFGPPAFVTGYTADPSSGLLTPIPGSPWAVGAQAHDLIVDPTGQFLYVASRTTNNIAGFSINPVTGALTALPNSPFASATGVAPNYITAIKVLQ